MDKVIVLMMSIVMPQNVPDIENAVRVDSAEECWTAAKKFAERELTDNMKAHGAIGLSAGCIFVEKSKDQKEKDKQQDEHKKQEEEREKL